MSQSIVLNWPELQNVLEPLIQQIVQKELNKLVSTPTKEVTALLPTDFWEALQQFRQETDLSEFAEDVFANVRDKSVGREVIC